MRTSPDTLLLYETLTLDALALLLFGLYFLLLHRYRFSIGLLLRALTIRGLFGQLIDDQSVAFRGFVSGARMVGFAALLTLLFKACLIWDAAASPSLRIPAEWQPWLLPLLIGVLVAIGCYKWLITHTISLLSERRSRIGSLLTFDRLYLSLAGLVLTPAVLLCALADPATERPLFVIAAIMLIVLLLYYIVKFFSLFVSRNFSILQGLLYLCAVEIFPISFFVLFVRRGFEW